MSKVTDLLDQIGLKWERDDGDEYALFCPFHNNTNSPAFSINKKTGLWICFNTGVCGKQGSLRDLAEHFNIEGSYVKEVSLDELEMALNEQPKEQLDQGWDEALERVSINYDSDDVKKLQYLTDRGFDLTTLKHFEVGFSNLKNACVIPARNEVYHLVGFIGRKVDPEAKPKYRYSKGFPRKDILFNLQNAKNYGSVIIVEGSLDAMSIHQAGLPNVVATLGANVTPEHIDLLNRYFNELIIFNDNDDPGEGMRDNIIKKCPQKKIRVITHDDPDVKDAGDLIGNPSKIRELVANSVDYLSWYFDRVLWGSQ